MTTVLNEPKTSTFQLRINPEYKQEVETLFAECGLTMSEAINIFLQMSLNSGGLPFQVKRAPYYEVSDKVADYIDAEYAKGIKTARTKADWISAADMRKKHRN